MKNKEVHQVDFRRKNFSGHEIKMMIKEELKYLEPIWHEIGTLAENLHNRLVELESALNALIKKEREKDAN